MAIENFDSFNSQTKKGKTLDRLFLHELEKEAQWYKKQVANAKKQVENSPQLSTKQRDAIQSLEQATMTALEFEQYLVYRAKQYVPTEGFQLESSKKDIAFANKYKTLDVAPIEQAAKTIRGNYDAYKMNRNAYVISPITLKVVNPIIAGKPFTVPAGPTGPSATAPAGATGPSPVLLTGVTGPSPTAPTGPSPTGTTGPAGAGTGGRVAGGRVAGGTTTKNKAKVPVNWEAKFREMFPTKTWMLDLDRSKYADVFKVIQDGVTNEAWLTPAAQQRFLGQLDNTSFIKELASTDMVRKVKAVVGDLGFDSLPFNSFLTKAMNLGWKDDVLKQEAYKEAFRKDDTNKFVNPTALARVKASNEYLSVKKVGTSYFSTIDDSTVEQTLTGGITLEDVERQQRELAKAKYGHLSNLLDQGFSLEKLTSSFKQQAAQLLEKDVNDIDMSQADYEQVINSGEEGKKRMMTTGEWEIKLRSDPRYNWGSTQNAKDEARRLSASIAQAFGKVI